MRKGVGVPIERVIGYGRGIGESGDIIWVGFGVCIRSRTLFTLKIGKDEQERSYSVYVVGSGR